MRQKSIATLIAFVFVTGAAAALIAGAQTPAKPNVVRVVSNTTANDSKRAPNGSATGTTAAPVTQPELLVKREQYSYPGPGRRDPFVSLMNTEELRPLLSDLKLVAIALDPTGRNSVAVLRDVSTKEQYRVKIGQELGRMRVAAIRGKEVVFGIEEFGYSRQETLAMTDSTKVRTQ